MANLGEYIQTLTFLYDFLWGRLIPAAADIVVGVALVAPRTITLLGFQ